MEWLFFQSQSHRPVHVRREVFIPPSTHLEIQLWGPCHSFYATFPKSVYDAVILCALIEDEFWSLRPPPLEGSYIEGPRPGQACAIMHATVQATIDTTGSAKHGYSVAVKESTRVWNDAVLSSVMRVGFVCMRSAVHRYLPECIRSRHIGSTPGFIVWRATSYNSRSYLISLIG